VRESERCEEEARASAKAQQVARRSRAPLLAPHRVHRVERPIFAMNRIASRRLRVAAFGWLLLVFAWAAFPATGALAQTDQPALWRIAGAKGSVYLFGSFHLLPEGVAWRTAALDRALAEASVVVLETDFDAANDPKAMLALISKYGMLPKGRTLAEALPPALNAEVERMAAGFGLPPAALAPLRPWLVAVTLSVQFIVREGHDPARGVDAQVLAWARANGRQIQTLETNESQLRIFADLTSAQEVEFLAVTLRQIRDTPQILSDMLSAYRRGDVRALEKVLNLGFDDFPMLRQRVLGDRHANWLPQIERMLASGRTHVVVVGAAHLVGPDSVIAGLRARGVKVEGP